MANGIKRLERKLLPVAPQLLTADGTTNGVVKVANACLFRHRQDLILRANLIDPLKVEVKEIADETTILVGPPSYSLKDRVDISAYTTALGATIEAPRQAIKAIDDQEINLASFERAPVAAHRFIPVDNCGNINDELHPVHVSVSGITVPPLEVMLTHKDNDPNQGDIHDSVRIGDGIETADVSATNELETADIINNGWKTTSVSIVAGNPIEVKVDATVRANRKLIQILPLDGKLKYGDLAGNLPFLLFKRQGARFAFGSTTKLFIDAVSGTVEVAIAEAS